MAKPECSEESLEDYLKKFSDKEFLLEPLGPKGHIEDPTKDKCRVEFYRFFWEEYMSKSGKPLTFAKDGIEIRVSEDPLFSFNTVAGIALRALKEYTRGMGNQYKDLSEVDMPKTGENRLKLLKRFRDKVDYESKAISCSLKDLCKKAEKFHDEYHTLANFMPLPKSDDGKPFMNSDKGLRRKYYDCPDRFFYCQWHDCEEPSLKPKHDYSLYYDLFKDSPEGDSERHFACFTRKNYLSHIFKQYVDGKNKKRFVITAADDELFNTYRRDPKCTSPCYPETKDDSQAVEALCNVLDRAAAYFHNASALIAERAEIMADYAAKKLQGKAG